MPVACASRMTFEIFDGRLECLNSVERITEHPVAVVAQNAASALTTGLFPFAAVVIVINSPTFRAGIVVAADGAPALVVSDLLLLFDSDSVLSQRCTVAFTRPTHPRERPLWLVWVLV